MPGPATPDENNAKQITLLTLNQIDLEQVLARLPVGSLLRLACTCRSLHTAVMEAHDATWSVAARKDLPWEHRAFTIGTKAAYLCALRQQLRDHRNVVQGLCKITEV